MPAEELPVPIDDDKSLSPDTVAMDRALAHFRDYMALYRELDHAFWRFMAMVPKIPDTLEDAIDWTASLPAIRLGPFAMSLLLAHTAHAVNLAGAIAVSYWDVHDFQIGGYGDPFQTAKIGIDAVRAQAKQGELLGWANHQQGLLDAAVLATGYRYE